MGQARNRHHPPQASSPAGRTIVFALGGGAAILVIAAGIWAGMALRKTAEKDLRGAPPSPVVVAPVILPDDKVHAQYAGSHTCKACHEAAYKQWQESNHHFAERPVEKTDLASFDPARSIRHGRDTSEAKLDAEGFAQLLTQGKDRTKKPVRLVRVIGHDPLRQFIVEGPGGSAQATELAWDPHKTEWFDVYGNENREGGEWGHWTGRGMSWNAQCAACHNTRLRKNYDPATDTYSTKMAEMSIGCESCHGPMKDHVDWQAKAPSIPGVTPAPAAKDPTLKKQTRDQMLETCAACHSRRVELTGDLVPGESFHDHFTLSVPDGSDLFYPDGQVRDEDYEFTAFLGSRMHASGVRCVDCHNPHTGKTILEGNALCMQCHSTGGARPGITKPAPIIDPVAHSRHGEASAGNQCVSCHMPVTTYMQRHPRHDHGFTIPDPKLTKDFGVPNACNRCHTDKDTEWAIAATEKWYGPKMERPTRTRAILFAKARAGDPSVREELTAFLKQPNEPLWQTSACHLLGLWAYEPAVAEALTAQFKHSSPLVREAAVRAVGVLAVDGDAATRFAIRPLLEDPSRNVRVAAAWMLRDEIDPASKAGVELLHMLRHGADQPTGQMQLGQYEFSRGNRTFAIAHFRKAVEWDPNSAPFRHDLAVALSASGDTVGAIRELQQAVKLSPDAADYHYKLGLAWGEAGSLENAIASFEETVGRAPEMPAAWINLATAYYQIGRREKAAEAAQRAAALNPNDPRVQELLRLLR